jgi:hypothetical protein
MDGSDVVLCLAFVHQLPTYHRQHIHQIQFTFACSVTSGGSQASVVDDLTDPKPIQTQPISNQPTPFNRNHVQILRPHVPLRPHQDGLRGLLPVRSPRAAPLLRRRNLGNGQDGDGLRGLRILGQRRQWRRVSRRGDGVWEEVRWRCCCWGAEGCWDEGEEMIVTMMMGMGMVVRLEGDVD